MGKHEPPIHRLLRRQSFAFLGAAGLLSVCIIMIGLLLDSTHPSCSKLLVVLGGSGLGTCFGLVFGGVTDSSALQRVRELIENSLSSTLYAPDQELEQFRKTWHHYILTKIEKQVVWRYRKLDFSHTSVPGKLVTAFNVPDPDGDAHTYNIEGYLAEPRLMFVQTPSGGTELPIIHLYPRATERFRQRHAGIAFLQSWDGENLMVTVLICASPLEFDGVKVSEGTMPKETYIVLNQIWQNEAKAVGLRIVDKDEEDSG